MCVRTPYSRKEQFLSFSKKKRKMGSRVELRAAGRKEGRGRSMSILPNYCREKAPGKDPLLREGPRELRDDVRKELETCRDLLNEG